MKKFRITVLILFAIGIVFMIMGLIVSNSNLKHDARSNTECRTDQRVFDYADKLTGNEERSLEKKIAKWEDKAGMDIVVMTIDNAQAQSMFGTYMDDTYYEEAPYTDIEVVDRIGSGDAYISGVLYGLLAHPGEYQRALEYGNAISALKNTIPGDLLCTDLKEIQGIIKEHKSTGRIAEMDR